MDGSGEVRHICEVRAGGESPAEHRACAKASEKDTKRGKEITMAQTQLSHLALSGVWPWVG